LTAGLFACLLAGCIFSPDKPREGENPPPGAPAVTWISITEGAVLPTGNVTVTWEGNEFSRRYRFTLDNVTSAWLDSASYSFFGLTSGKHTLVVQAANDSLVGGSKTVHFSVNTSAGPRIFFSPDAISAISYITLDLDNVSGLMAAHIEIACGDSSAQMRKFEVSKSDAASGAIILADSTDPFRLILDIGFGGLPGGFTGSLELGSFVVSPSKTNGLISFDTKKTAFRDTGNHPLAFGRFGTLRISR
jgi:hypothetical protein